MAWTTTVRVYPPDGSGAGTDISCLVDKATVHHGRDDSGTQPEASTLGLDFTVSHDAPLPAVVEVGAVITLTHATPTVSSQRFWGRITDLALGWDDVGADTPDAGVGQLSAAGPLADLGRRTVGDVPYPQELDGARVSRIMAAAGFPLDPLYSDPGTVQIVARDIDSQPALTVSHGVAESGSGVVWQTKGGVVRYADAMHRRGIPVALTLDACDILVTPTWRRTLEGLVNKVSIGYGVQGAGAQPQYVDSNAASISRYGTWGYSVTTELAALADAQALGQALLVRNSSPIWVMAALPVDIPGLSAADYDTLLGLDMHALVSLTGLPAIGGAPTTAALWVEGWKEEFQYQSHVIELVVSGYCRTVPAPRWDDVDPSWLWGGNQWTELRRNLIPNPNFERDVAGWVPYAGVAQPVQDASTPYAGAWRLRADGNGTSTAPRVMPQAVTGLQAGEVYTLSARIRHDGTWPGGGTAYLALRFQTSPSGEVVTAATPAFAADGAGYMRVTVTGTVPANTNGQVILNAGFAGLASALTAAGSIGVDNVMLEKAPTVGTYFDGDTPDYPGADYAWLGVPGASVSTVTGFKETRRNLSRSPRTLGGGWVSNDGPTFGVALNQAIADHPQGITPGAKVTRLASASAPTQLASVYDVDALGNTSTPRCVGVWVKTPVAATVTVYLTGTAGTSKTTAVPANVWTYCTSTATPGTGYSLVNVFVGSGNAVTGQVTMMTGSVSDPAAIPASFFDGATPDPPGQAYEWTGAPDASASVLQEVSRIPGGVDPNLTWDDLACLGPPVYLGRWDDQPASLRWNQVPPTTTWDNYGG